jgi:hypothetical protein
MSVRSYSNASNSAGNRDFDRRKKPVAAGDDRAVANGAGEQAQIMLAFWDDPSISGDSFWRPET